MYVKRRFRHKHMKKFNYQCRHDWSPDASAKCCKFIRKHGLQKMEVLQYNLKKSYCHSTIYSAKRLLRVSSRLGYYGY